MFKKAILITGAIIIVGVGYWIFKENMASEKTKDNNQVTQDETLDWATYTNGTYQYEIKYPANCRVQKEGEEPFPGPPQGVQFSVQLKDQSYCNINVEASGYNQYEIDDLRSKEYKETSVIIDGINSIVLTSSENGGNIFIYLKDNNHDFRITRGGVSGESTEGDCNTIFNQMLSTINFLK